MKKYSFGVNSFIVEEEKIWFVPAKYNYLCCYNMKTKELEKKVRLPEPNRYIRMFENIHSVGNLLYLVPFNGSDILIYDKKNETFKKIFMKPYDNKTLKFYASCIYKGHLFLFPQRVMSSVIKNPFIVIKVDLERKENLKEQFLNISVRPQVKDCGEIFGIESYVEENKIYLLFVKSNKILEYNLDNGEHKIIEIGSLKNEYSSMYKERNMFYFINQNGNVTVWDKNKDNVFEYQNSIHFEVEKRMFGSEFHSSIGYGNFIYFFPMLANKVLCFDKEKKRISEAFFSKEIVEKFSIKDKDRKERLSKVIVKENTVFLWNLCNHIFYTINLDTKEIQEWKIEAMFSSDELKQLYHELDISIKKSYMEQDTGYGTLSFFLQQVLLQTRNMNEEESIGKLIYSISKRYK